jgi:hypothetical protein
MADNTPDLPAIPGSMPFIHNVDTAPAYWWLDILWVILVDGKDTGGRYSLMHETLPKDRAHHRTNTPGRTSISTFLKAKLPSWLEKKSG